MSDHTGIAWTDATWGVSRGCSRVSDGCKNCYAERVASRFNGPGLPYEGLVKQHLIESHAGLKTEPRWTGEVRFIPEALDQPLRWKRPRRIFVNSTSDLFHEKLTDEQIAVVFGVMAACPQHQFQVLTKRPERMRAWCSNVYRPGLVNDAMILRGLRIAPVTTEWPLPNVWLGCSVENQETADERIPLLLQTPAVVRFLSCEPLLGPIDLKGWGDQAPAPNWQSAPATWGEFTWPEWVPAGQRKQVEDFWSAEYGRGPQAWLRDHIIQHVPATGARVRCAVADHGWATVNKMASVGVEGRYLHSWNNIGRIITDDGNMIPASGGSGSGWLSRWLTPKGDYAPKLNWVIAGSESGPSARPAHPNWHRALRDQCVAAKVPFFFKQWGEWTPGENVERTRGIVETAKLFDGKWILGRENLADTDCRRDDEPDLYRVGKKVAGDLLDGQQWHEFPT